MELQLDETNIIKPGMELLVTRWIGMQGTARIAGEKAEELRSRLPLHLIEEAQKLAPGEAQIEEDMRLIRECGSYAIFMPGDGGILSALWKFAQASGVGLEIDLRSIPVRQETIEICEFYRINPYMLQSQGALLVAGEQLYTLQRTFHRMGIAATVIGSATSGNDRVLWKEDERGFLNRPQPDEITKVLNI